MTTLDISGYTATEALGKALATLLARNPVPCLFRGEMGSGKTTLISKIVENLPGGDMAEPSSPSFAICNHYPTTPPVLHCDLYRVDGDVPEEIYEFLQQQQGLLLAEWAERLVASPSPRLDISLNVVNDRRLMAITGHGAQARSLERELAAWPPLADFAGIPVQHQR